MSRFLYLVQWYLRARLFGRKAPLQSVIFISDLCNLRCKHCSVYAIAQPRIKSLRQIEEELRYCYDLGSRFVDFEGGELYLWRDRQTLPDGSVVEKRIDDVLDLAKQIGFYSATITTNAQLPFQGSHADQVWVSMDGIGKWHDEIRGEGAFAKLEKNIAESGRKDICVNMVVNNLNYPCLKETLDYVKQNPYIQMISINFHTPFPETRDLALPQDIRRQVVEDVIRYKRQGYPIMNSISGLKNMLKLNFKQYCWITNFIFSDGSKSPMCMGYTHDVCDECGFCMGGEMGAVYNLRPDTIVSGLKLRLH